MRKLFKYEKLLVLVLILIFFWTSIAILRSSNFTKENSNTKEVKSIITPTINNRPFLIKGSIPYWDEKAAVESFKDNISSFDYINLFLYYIGENGEVVKYSHAEEDRNLIESAHKNNVKVSAVITNLPENPDSWSSKRVEKIIYSDALTQEHIENITEVLNEFNFDGIIIDYELLDSDTKDKYSEFIRKLSIELKNENKILTTVLHPKTGENIKGESVSRYQDWVKLAQYSDQIQIMGYSEHTDEDDPGPIASIGWVKKIIGYSQSLGIPPEKIFLGIPLYGYDWDKSTDKPAKGLTFKEVSELLENEKGEAEFDDYKKSPTFKYGTHEVWFENAQSVYAKAQLAKKANFAGITFWRLGKEDQSVWKVLENLDD